MSDGTTDNRMRFLRWLVGLPRSEQELSRPRASPHPTESPGLSGPDVDADDDALLRPLAERMASLEEELAAAEARAEHAEARLAELRSALTRAFELWFGGARNVADAELGSLLVADEEPTGPADP